MAISAILLTLVSVQNAQNLPPVPLSLSTHLLVTIRTLQELQTELSTNTPQVQMTLRALIRDDIRVQALIYLPQNRYTELELLGIDANPNVEKHLKDQVDLGPGTEPAPLTKDDYKSFAPLCWNAKYANYFKISQNAELCAGELKGLNAYRLGHHHPTSEATMRPESVGAGQTTWPLACGPSQGGAVSLGELSDADFTVGDSMAMLDTTELEKDQSTISGDPELKAALDFRNEFIVLVTEDAKKHVVPDKSLAFEPTTLYFSLSEDEADGRSWNSNLGVGMVTNASTTRELGDSLGRPSYIAQYVPGGRVELIPGCVDAQLGNIIPAYIKGTTRTGFRALHSLSDATMAMIDEVGQPFTDKEYPNLFDSSDPRLAHFVTGGRPLQGGMLYNRKLALLSGSAVADAASLVMWYPEAVQFGDRNQADKPLQLTPPFAADRKYDVIMADGHSRQLTREAILTALDKDPLGVSALVPSDGRGDSRLLSR